MEKTEISTVDRPLEDESVSGGSAESAVVVVLAWIVAIGVGNVLLLLAAACGFFLLLLAGYAFPTVGGLLTQTEVIPMIEEKIDEYVPGFLSQFRNAGIARTILIVAAAVALLCLVLEVIGCFRLFRKAGEHPVFLFIPVVNLYKLCSIANGGFLMFLCMLLPGVQFFAVVAMSIGLSRAFGRSAFYAVPLLLLPPLFLNLLTVNREFVE